MRTHSRAALLAGALAVLACGATAQGTREDYERAAKLAERTRGTVAGLELSPSWIDGGARLAFRLDRAGGERVFVVVDTETGERRPAFDHALVAARARAELGGDFDPARLPVERLAWQDDGSLSLLMARGDELSVAVVTGEDVDFRDVAEENPFTLEPRPFSRRLRSRRAGGEVRVAFVNRTAEPLKLFWVDASGIRRSRGEIAPDGVHVQRTFTRHAWLLAGSDDEPRACFVAGEESAVAVVTDEPITGDEEDDDADRPERFQRESNTRSPDERWRVRFRDGNASVVERESREEHALTTDAGEHLDYRGPVLWSPTSRHVVFMRHAGTDEREVHVVESAPDDELQPKLHTFGYRKPGDPIDRSVPVLFDVEAMHQVPIDEALFPDPWSIDRLHWTPDGSRFFFLYNQRGHQVLRLVAVDAETGTATAVIDETSDTFIDYAFKTYLHFLDGTDEAVWMSERSGWNHLYLVDTRTGEVVSAITEGEWVVRGVERIDEEARQVWLRIMGYNRDQDPYHVHYARVDLDHKGDGTGFTLLTEGDGTHELAFSPDRRMYVDTWSRVDQPPVHELRRSADGSLVCELARADWKDLLATGWQPPERFVAKGRDGETDIYGIILKPTTFDPAKSYAVIEQIYAGPHGQHVPKAFSRFHGAQATAEIGFVVVQIDGMGTNWRSRAFHDVAWKNIADAGFPDRIAWMRAAAKDRPYMDLSRVGIYGGSAGGQNAMRAVLDHADFYKAAAADCGCHDNRMDKIWWNEAWMGYPVDESYARSSNVVDAHKLGGALLLTVGELDRNVDPASTMQVVDALIEADKDFELIVFPGRGHGAGGSPYGVRRRNDFFVRHLLGVEPRREP